LRHTFRTIADETLDAPAIDYVMGHTRDDVASRYRERISDDRLRRVVEHVRRRLFGDEAKPMIRGEPAALTYDPKPAPLAGLRR
jgi:hypothetical protein